MERSDGAFFTMPAYFRTHSPNEGPRLGRRLAVFFGATRGVRVCAFDLRAAGVGMKGKSGDAVRSQASAARAAADIVGAVCVAGIPLQISKAFAP